MILKLKVVDLVKLAFIVLPALSACAPAPRFFLQYGSELKQAQLDKILADHPLVPGENIKVTTLGQGATVSHHLVQIRDREVPRVHKAHDVTVTLFNGQGDLTLDQRRIELSAGDAIYIPRDTLHYFVNTSSEPAVALAVYSPPFDGKDTLPAQTR
jgi:mannose-6-phosphate isomerase-like protein (cupin superfamily)